MPNEGDTPKGDVSGFVRFLRYDILSGFLVFLIALPLCLAIAKASGFPPIAGIFTAIVGSIVTTFLSNSELTIKGPAAGLIVIVAGCVAEFGGMSGVEETGAYRMALAVGFAAAVLQVLFGLFRAGFFAEFFPTSAVHGMLAAIGVIIIAKQIPVALGVQATGEPLELLGQIPQFVLDANPAIALIGVVSIAIMFLWPLVGERVPFLKSIPSPFVVLLAAIPMGMAFDLLHKHNYYLQGHEYQLSEQYLVDMPDRVFGMFEMMTTPDFSVLAMPVAWKWVLMFFLIGSLESLLSAKAIELLDPWKRKTDMNRDMLGVGVANLASSMVGGLPMISEIVRSKANIDNGARTRFANMWHGIFLLVCVALIPTVLHRIPYAALAGMLVYTGFRLAHPTEFVNIYRIGREQLVIFVSTIVAVLATDLLIGIAIGILVKLVIHVANGVPLRSLFKPFLSVEQQNDNTSVIRAHHSAVFSNWIPFKRQIEDIGLVQRQNIVIDLSDTNLVDHSVMDKLHELQREFEQEGLSLDIVGLDVHRPLAPHKHAARKRGLTKVRRLTVVADACLEQHLTGEFVKLGATGYNSLPCTGAGRRLIAQGQWRRNALVRIEVVAPKDVCEKILLYLRREIQPYHQVTACVEVVEVVALDQFTSLKDEPIEVFQHN